MSLKHIALVKTCETLFQGNIERLLPHRSNHGEALDPFDNGDSGSSLSMYYTSDAVKQVNQTYDKGFTCLKKTTKDIADLLMLSVHSLPGTEVAVGTA